MGVDSDRPFERKDLKLPDGRRLYLYTFEKPEEPEPELGQQPESEGVNSKEDEAKE